ncbi:MAG TPA: glycosyl hydrolase [Bacteroidales bacterium]|nr:glycosyl hydrolase [Bacteroidales bacterium]
MIRFGLFLLLVIPFSVSGQKFEPCNPDATPEAKALIHLYYQISGKYTLTGQHNYPNTKDQNTRFAAKYEGQTPVIWSSDMGFAKDGDYDSYLARPDIVREAIRQHKKGSIITLCWHAVPPTANEPVTFQPRRKVSADSLESVQGRLPDYQFRDLLTPGTAIYNHWASQVDTIAHYLRMLQDAHVPVLWRPYHEMNGDWFWWGGRVGEYSTSDLYRQLYDRLVNYHKLNNLVWVWNVDRPTTPIRKFSNFYPGDKFLDILSLDVYGSDFNKAYYDSLMALSHGKPILFGEVGNPPSLEILKAQPNWASWVIWAGFVRSTSRQQFKEFVQSNTMVYYEDPSYAKATAEYRKTCGLPSLPLQDLFNVNYAGEWILDENKSMSQNGGIADLPYKMIIAKDAGQLMVKKFFAVEWADDRISNEEIMLDGTPVSTKTGDLTRTSIATFNSDNKSLSVNALAKVHRTGQVVEFKSTEVWNVSPDGKSLTIEQTSAGNRGETLKTTLVFSKKYLE